MASKFSNADDYFCVPPIPPLTSGSSALEFKLKQWATEDVSSTSNNANLYHHDYELLTLAPRSNLTKA